MEEYSEFGFTIAALILPIGIGMAVFVRQSGTASPKAALENYERARVGQSETERNWGSQDCSLWPGGDVRWRQSEYYLN